jgi:iron complex outermembrane receptor protein
MMKNILAGGLTGGAILLAALLMAAPVASAAEDEQKEPVALDQITVKEKAVAEPVTSPYWVPDSSRPQTLVITREEIEAINPQTIWDLLEQVPGMDVFFQGRQHLDFGYVRGSGNFGIILDGVYLLSPDRVVATLPVTAIESITVVRDATALTLGPLTNFGTTTGNSNQGYIVIKTKRAKKKVEGGLVASYGSFHTQKEDLYQGAKIGDFDYMITGSDQSSLGKTNWYNGNRNESLLFHGGYDGPFVQGDVLYYAGRGMQEFERGTIEVPTSTTVKGVTTYNWSNVGNLDTSKWKLDPIISNMVAVNLKKPWSDSQTTTFTYAYDSLLTSSMTTTFPTQTPVTVQDQDIHGQNLNVTHVYTAGSNVLKAGGQFLESVSPTGLAPSVGTRTDESVYSLFLVDQYRLFNGRMTVDGAIRMDQKHYNDNPVTGAPLHEWAKDVTTLALGTSYKLTPMFTLTGRYSHVENTTASYYTTPTTLAALPPEIDTRYEGGIIANVHPWFNPVITGFYYDSQNQAVTNGKYYVDPATGQEIDYVTPLNVRTKGAEFRITGEPLKSLAYGSLTYRLQYAYVTTDSHTDNVSIAHNIASGLISYRYKNAFANLTFVYEGPHNLSTSPMGVVYYQLGNFIRVDSNVGYSFKLFNRDMRFTVYARNLGDVHYATRYVSGAYLDPGLSYGVRLAVSFF